MAYPALHTQFLHAVMAGRRVSSGECPGEKPGAFVPRVNPEHLNRTFPGQWAAWLKANRFDARRIVAAFNVDDRTARNWLAGISAPRASVLVVLEVQHPGTIAEIVSIGVAA